MNDELFVVALEPNGFLKDVRWRRALGVGGRLIQLRDGFGATVTVPANGD